MIVKNGHIKHLIFYSNDEQHTAHQTSQCNSKVNSNNEKLLSPKKMSPKCFYNNTHKHSNYIQISFFLSNTTNHRITHTLLWLTWVLLVVQCSYMFQLIQLSSGDTLTNFIPLNYNSYMDPYILLSVLQIIWKNVLLSFSLITFICTDYVVAFLYWTSMSLKTY
jgi:hypothetical protein